MAMESVWPCFSSPSALLHVSPLKGPSYSCKSLFCNSVARSEKGRPEKYSICITREKTERDEASQVSSTDTGKDGEGRESGSADDIMHCVGGKCEIGKIGLDPRHMPIGLLLRFIFLLHKLELSLERDEARTGRKQRW